MVLMACNLTSLPCQRPHEQGCPTQTFSSLHQTHALQRRRTRLVMNYTNGYLINSILQIEPVGGGVLKP